jgi:apolipoprotein D and lipocalin family protein
MFSLTSFVSSCTSNTVPFCLFPEVFGSTFNASPKQIDLEKYSGKWHEIARLPQRHQVGCVETTAEYSIDPEASETVNVLNTCFDKSGVKRQARAQAMSVSDNNSMLKVYFTKYFGGNYWILDIDDDYQWAVVGEPCRKYAWILSRTPDLDQETIDKRVQMLKENGFKVENLIFRGDSD